MIESKKPWIIAVIPCYNEERHIYRVIKETQKQADTVIVVDNMSTDSTMDIARELVGDNAVRCEVMGVGAATKAGMNFAVNALSCNKDSIIVTLDGDGQHDPCDILNLIYPIRNGRADAVFGYRNGEMMPVHRRLGNKILNLVCNIGTPLKIKDSQCGFRAFTVRVASDLLKVVNHGNGFGYIMEVALCTKKMGYRISQVPVTCIYHNGHNDNSTLNPVLHGVSVITSTIKRRVKERGLNEKVA